MRGDAQDVYPAGGVLDHDEDVEAAEEDGVDVGEVDREDRVSLRRQDCRQVGPDRLRAVAARSAGHEGADQAP